MRLDELSVGQSARVAWVHREGAIGERLMEMGLVPGAEVRVLRRSVGRSPLQLRLREYVLSLRADDANTIEVSI